MNEITDSLSRRIDYLPLDLIVGEETATLRVLVVPSNGATLKSTGDANVQVFARDVDGDNLWVDLSLGVDLSALPYGVQRNFDVKFKAGDVVGQVRAVSWFGVIKSDTAGWGM